MITALLLSVSGCSTDDQTSTVPSGQTDASSSASSAPLPGQESPEAGSVEDGSAAIGPQEPLGPEGCIDVTGANLNLAVADSADEARAAADIFAKFDPPASVTEALQHFVGTGGVHLDDPDFDEHNTRIDDWVKAVCPLPVP
jgi:hypothetical protein